MHLGKKKLSLLFTRALGWSLQSVAVIDSLDDDAMIDEPANNLRSTELSLSKDRPTAPLADLVLENIVLSSNVALQGDIVQIQLEVTNRGVQPAQASRLKYYLSSRDVYDSRPTISTPAMR